MFKSTEKGDEGSIGDKYQSLHGEASEEVYKVQDGKTVIWKRIGSYTSLPVLLTSISSDMFLY